MSTESTTTPLLRPRQGAGESQSRGGRANTLTLLLGRDSRYHGVSMLLRETAVPPLKEIRVDWGLIDFGSYAVKMGDIIELAVVDIGIADTKSTFALAEYIVDLFARYRKMGVNILNL
ncbi:hypothetical protein L1987_64900 [Smallanthus sonchifolius]|uniref:Uncharacterized protein n=1 Tax=Smallanthus sonchifolius TaxID=185202 RepID=A0ACB9BT76_9ASTR|nr:hypothetical protein L1987_64900 [Smallanthus sonchifolius]